MVSALPSSPVATVIDSAEELGSEGRTMKTNFGRGFTFRSRSITMALITSLVDAGLDGLTCAGAVVWSVWAIRLKEDATRQINPTIASLTMTMILLLLGERV